MASTEREPVEQLAEEWRARWRRGEQFSAEEYVARCPELAGEIRELFPAIELMEQLKPLADDLTGAFTVAPGFTPAAGGALERLGDYRILREIGRGGMGVVYEAEQESLGRRVALKVLPAGAAQRLSYLERFRREARAVAKLHHTNIVPVFGVGEEDGTCYYAMQYIQGQPLDVVLEEVKRLRGVRGTVARGGMACSVAQSLLADRFPDAEPTVTSGEATRPKAPLPALRTDLSDHRGTGYYRRVALLGVQAAEGLAHAHGQGVLHRDIKPSNLLLDLHGTLWITDFGLAKSEDSANLTQAGDIVGTVRYMAPERFEGKADARSDLYAVGLTLYELLALQPPFTATERVSLIGQITSETPPPLRVQVPDVPRDLETIVLKAMAREPASRYGSAAELADDLHRFLENRPIRARRVSTVERFGRWCRRNPVVASLTLTVFLLLAVCALGSTGAAFWLQAERDAARQAEEHAHKAEESGTEKLYESYVAQAKASRFSRQPGQRFASLAAIREAVRIARERQLPHEQIDELRNLAIACLALPDWRTVREWQAFPAGRGGWACDDRQTIYVRQEAPAHLSVRRVDDDGEIARLPFPPSEFEISVSPTGRFVLASGQGLIRVWDLHDPQHRLVLERRGQTGVAFHPDGKHYVAGGADGSIWLVDLTAPTSAPRLVARLPGGPVALPAFDASGSRLAVVQGGVVALVDVSTGKLLGHLPEVRVEHVAWHPRGAFLAVVTDMNKIRVWDVARQQRVAVLDGCRNGGVFVAFTPDGELLASNGWEGKLRLWNWRTGQQVLRQSGGSNLRFSPEGRLMIVAGTQGQVVQLAPGREYRSLARQSNAGNNLQYWNPTIHPDGRLLIVEMSDGLRLFDLETGDEVGLVPLPAYAHVTCTASDGLVTNGNSGLCYWPMQRTAEPGSALSIGPPRLWRQPGYWMQVVASADGRVVVQACYNNGARILHRDRLDRPILLGPQPDVRNVAISPEREYVATASFGAPGIVKVWEAHTGHFIKDVPLGPYAGAVFSADGRWLAAHGDRGGRILHVGTWAEAAQVAPGDHMQFSPDSRFLAVAHSDGSIRLHDAATGRERARLEDPNQDTGLLTFTPDGLRLVVSSDEGRAVHVWDLRRIREQLAELDLDWDTTPLSPAPPPAHEPLRVRIVGAELARSAFAMRRYEAQENALRLVANPFDADAYFQLGRGQWLTGNLGQALPNLNLALALQPHHAGARYLRAQLHQRYGRWQQACDDYTALLAVQPDDYELYRLRGIARLLLGDPAAAAADLGEWLKHGALDAYTLNNVAWKLVERPRDRRDAELALPLIEKAVAQSPADANIVHTLGVTYYRLARYDDALATLQRTAQQPGGQLRAYELYFLAMCHHQRHDGASAKREFDAAVRWQAQAKLLPAQLADLQAFRAEAEALLIRKAP